MPKQCIALLLLLCLLIPCTAPAEGIGMQEDWITFLLICNEGMQNVGTNVGNVIIIASMSPYQGKVRLAAMAWDTFINYEGYDVPQLIDQPYRNGGPTEVLKVINQNFGLDIPYYLSLNYLNLAALIDTMGGVEVDITRAERNAINGMVDSKKDAISSSTETGVLSQLFVEMVAQETYLSQNGPDTHLSGLQAVSFGWLQYDSVYNCCERDQAVISNLFDKLGQKAVDTILFCTDETYDASMADGRRAINLDHLTEDDFAFLGRVVNPIFEMTENNLTADEIKLISLALVYSAFEGARQGVDIFAAIDQRVFPLESQNPLDNIAGIRAHIIDKEANIAALHAFLYGAEEAQ